MKNTRLKLRATKQNPIHNTWLSETLSIHIQASPASYLTCSIKLLADFPLHVYKKKLQYKLNPRTYTQCGCRRDKKRQSWFPSQQAKFAVLCREKSHLAAPPPPLSRRRAHIYKFNFHVNGEHDYIFKAANERVYTIIHINLPLSRCLHIAIWLSA